MTEYGRKPYQQNESQPYKADLRGGGTGYRAMMSKATDFISLKKERHSEFKKPYQAADYNDMENQYAPPDGSTPGDGVTPGATPGKGFCWASCDINRAGIYQDRCVNGKPKMKGTMPRGAMVEYTSHGIARYYDCYSIGGVERGFGFESTCFEFANVDEGETVTVKFRRPIHTACPGASEALRRSCRVTRTALADCDACPADSTFAWDDAGSDDTIVRSGTAAIAVIAGVVPYTWSVSGTGFTLASSVTTALTNTLNADGTACGTATITVTDGNSCEITGYVRCTTGTWNSSSQPWCTIKSGQYYTAYYDRFSTKCGPWAANYGTYAESANCGVGVVTQIIGKYKIVEETGTSACVGDCPPNYLCGEYFAGYGTPYPTMWPASCAFDGYCRWLNTRKVQEWTC